MHKKIAFHFLLTLLISTVGSMGQACYDSDETILNMEELVKRHFTNTADLIGYCPGLTIRHIGIPGQWTALNRHGQNLNQATILVDGIRLQDPWTGFADLNWIPVEWIDTVAIAPVQDPSNAFTQEAIAFRTKGADTKRPFTSFSYRKAKNSFSHLDITFNQPLGHKLKIVSGLTREEYGKQIVDRTSNQTILRSKLLYQLSRNCRIDYTLLSNKQELGLPFTIILPGDTIISNNLKRTTRRTDHALKVSGSLFNLSSDLTLHYASLNFKYQNQEANRNFPVRVFDMEFIQKHDRGAIPIFWGFSFQRNEINYPATRASGDLSRETGLNTPERIYQNLADAFVQSQFSIRDRFCFFTRISPHFSDYGNHISGASEVSYRFTPSFNGWLRASTGFKTPVLGEISGLVHQPFPLYIIDPNRPLGRIASNPSLQLETNRTIESGFGWKAIKKMRISMRGYGHFIRNGIAPGFNHGKFQFMNTEKYRFWGVESRIEAGPIFGLHTDICINSLNAKNNLGNTLYDRPIFWGNAALIEELALFQNDLLLVLYIGCRFSSGYWNLDSIRGSSIWLPGWFFLDWKITTVIMHNARLFLSMDNLMESRAQIISGFPFMEKTFQMGITWDLID